MEYNEETKNLICQKCGTTLGGHFGPSLRCVPMMSSWFSELFKPFTKKYSELIENLQ